MHTTILTKAQKARFNGRRKVATAKAKSNCSRSEEYRLLRTTLNTWVHNEKEGASELRAKVQGLPSFAEKLAFLKKYVAKAPFRGRVPSQLGKEASSHRQAKEIVFDSLSVPVVRKKYTSSSLALKRTLAIYGYIRILRLEGTLPLPNLLETREEGGYTTVVLKNVGPDYNQYKPICEKHFRELRELAIAQLVAAGFNARISRRFKNWCASRKGASWKVWLIDVGNSSITKAASRKANQLFNSL